MGRRRGPGLDVVTGQAPPSRPRPPTCFPCLPSITEPLPAARSPGRPGRERCYSGTCTDHDNPTLLRAPECYLWIRLDTRNLLISAVFIQPGVRHYTAYVWSTVGRVTALPGCGLGSCPQRGSVHPPPGSWHGHSAGAHSPHSCGPSSGEFATAFALTLTLNFCSHCPLLRALGVKFILEMTHLEKRPDCTLEGSEAWSLVVIPLSLLLPGGSESHLQVQ